VLLWSFRACKFLPWFLSLSKKQIQEIGNAESFISFQNNFINWILFQIIISPINAVKSIFFAEHSDFQHFFLFSIFFISTI
jgi:hypothetical protein